MSTDGAESTRAVYPYSYETQPEPPASPQLGPELAGFLSAA